MKFRKDRSFSKVMNWIYFQVFLRDILNTPSMNVNTVC